VVAAAVIVPPKRAPAACRRLVDDSKRLTATEREAAFAALLGAARRGEIVCAVAAASSREVDELNVLRATFLAMRRALARLPAPPALALVDGALVPPGLACPARALVGGDGLSFSIAAASILAKVVRDRAMTRLAARHPGFGWETNMGYGTAAHLQGIESRGPTPHHRLSFAPLAQARLGI
jgi:ribonuclease HII